MPRRKKTASTDELLNELTDGLARLVAAARDEGREGALAELRGVLGETGGAKATRGGKRGRKAASTKTSAKKTKRTKSGKKRKNPWANLTDERRLARVNAIRKGRGLPLKKSL